MLSLKHHRNFPRLPRGFPVSPLPHSLLRWKACGKSRETQQVASTNIIFLFLLAQLEDNKGPIIYWVQNNFYNHQIIEEIKRNLDVWSNGWLQKQSLTEHKEKHWPFPDKYQRQQECSATNSNICFHTLLRVLWIEAEPALFLLGKKTDAKSPAHMWSELAVWLLSSQTLPVHVNKDLESSLTRTTDICGEVNVLRSTCLLSQTVALDVAKLCSNRTMSVLHWE